MKCYNISEPIIKTWRSNKNIKEFIDLLKDTDNEKSDLKNAEELLEGFPSSGISPDEAEIIKGQLRDFIKEEKIKNPLKSNPFSYLPDDFKLSIWVGNNHTDKIKY